MGDVVMLLVVVTGRNVGELYVHVCLCACVCAGGLSNDSWCWVCVRAD